MAEDNTAPKAQLHAQIMNLPRNPSNEFGLNSRTAYLLGHKDARHAAAELAAAAIAQRDAEIAALRNAIGTVCEGWTLPDGVHKVLKTALWSNPAAVQAPAAKAIND